VSSTDIEDIYVRLFPILASKCQRMLGDSFEAQDVAQETFVRFWQHRDRMRDPIAATSWLYRTATRLALDHLRQKGTVRREGDGAAAALLTDSTEVGVGGARVMLTQLTAALGSQELEVLVLSRVDGMTHPEIAGVLDTSERTVRRRLVRAEERLQELGLALETPR
jgi:RNA polymerase sigma-70 factor (ECF subfamily)